MHSSSRRWTNLREIEKLDPHTDFARINTLFMKDFEPAFVWVGFAANAVTYAIPSISRILREGGLYNDVKKRFVDTAILTSAMYEGLTKTDGREALRRMNQMHRMYPIKAEDFVWVSVLESVMLIRAAERFGWRDVHPHERQSMIQHALVRASHMNVVGVPTTFDEAAAHFDTYLASNSRFEPQNKELADVMMNMLLQEAPRPARPVARVFMLSATDPNTLRAMGYPVLPRPVRTVVNKVWRLLVRLQGPGEQDVDPAKPLIDAVYPQGYTIPELGTFAVGKCPVSHAGSDSASHSTANRM